MPGPAPPRSSAEESVDLRERILEATYRCIAGVGLAKTTVEDAARLAGVSRATIYRHFPAGKDELVRAAVAWEATRFFARLASEVVDVAAEPGALVEAALMRGQEAVEGHEVLQKVLHTEPDVLMRQLTVEGTRILGMIRRFLSTLLTGKGLPEGVDAEVASDYLARMILTHITAPGSWDLADPDQVHELVSTQLLGWMEGGSRAC